MMCRLQSLFGSQEKSISLADSLWCLIDLLTQEVALATMGLMELLEGDILLVMFPSTWTFL